MDPVCTDKMSNPVIGFRSVDPVDAGRVLNPVIGFRSVNPVDTDRMSNPVECSTLFGCSSGSLSDRMVYTLLVLS